MRLTAVDRLRGLLMVVMALDHTSYFVARRHPGEWWGIPLPSYDSGAWFLTRFVTHLAAPGFFLLMGASMVMLAETRGRTGWSDAKLRRFFVTRGLLLILLQHLVENPAWLLGTIGAVPAGVAPPGGGGAVYLHFGVLYALGAAMIAGAFLLRAPVGLIALLGISSLVTTQLFVPGPPVAHELLPPARLLLITPGHNGILQVFYPFIPWFGIAALGLLLGRALVRDAPRALRLALPAGAALVVLFVAIRVVNGLGNIHPVEGPGMIAFFNLTKYPPSLVFVSFTLGVGLILLGLFARFDSSHPSERGVLATFGRSALFFYIAHLYLYYVVGLPFPAGTTLPVMYAAWLLGLVLLYHACRVYYRFKQSRPAESVWRLF